MQDDRRPAIARDPGGQERDGRGAKVLDQGAGASIVASMGHTGFLC